MTRFDSSPLGVTQLKPRRWYDTTFGARFGLAAAVVLPLLIAAVIIRAVSS